MNAEKSKIFLVCTGIVAVSCIAAALPIRRNINSTVTARLEEVLSGRVMWSCRGCPQGFLVPTSTPDSPRSWVRLQDMPPVLVKGVISVEDHRFFTHKGIDTTRTAGAFLHGVKNLESPRGTSTLTQQLSRTLFLSRERTLARKVKEAMYAFALEDRLSKEQILELYLNTVPLGGAGPFEVNGFSDASLGYFGKDLRSLSASECALLAAMVQRPSSLNPRVRPAAAKQRRNLVLSLMRKNGVISEAEEQRSKLVEVSAPAIDDAAPNSHYLQLAAREFRKKYRATAPVEAQLTLDPVLQKAALAAVHKGLDKLNKRKSQDKAKIEAALVALDPRTGAVRALVGGYSFANSQVNRAVSQRQPGSVFKPFVYAAALVFASRDGQLGPYSEVNDEPRRFWFNGKAYEPHNFHGYHVGRVTLQEALNRSLNVPAVRVAEAVGYARVAAVANAAGLSVEPTPSAALGSYEVSPLALAAAYTAFSNNGVAVKPFFIEAVRDINGMTVSRHSPSGTRVLRADTAARMTMMLAGVNTYGTAASASRLGFPTAGKTGTDDDGWFAGFSSNLVCVVWVGYDDNRDLGMEGAKSALPIWVEFMAAAHKLPTYKKVNQFPQAPYQNAVYHVDPLPPDHLVEPVETSESTALINAAKWVGGGFRKLTSPLGFGK